MNCIDEYNKFIQQIEGQIKIEEVDRKRNEIEDRKGLELKYNLFYSFKTLSKMLQFDK